MRALTLIARFASRVSLSLKYHRRLGYPLRMAWVKTESM